MPFTWRGIEYRIPAHEGPNPTEAITMDGANGSMLVSVNWDERFTAMKEFVGYSELAITDSEDFVGHQYIKRYTPIPNIRFQADISGITTQSVQGFLYCDGCQARGVHLKAQSKTGELAIDEWYREPTYDAAYLTLSLSSRPYLILADGEVLRLQQDNLAQFQYPDEALFFRYVSAEYKPRAKFQTIPEMQSLQFNIESAGGVGTQGRPVSRTAGITLHEGDVRITWHEVPIEAIPWDAIRACVGKTNTFVLAPFSSFVKALIGNIGSGELVCNYPEIDYYRMANGGWCADIHYNFTHYPNGANQFYDWQNGRFTPVSRNKQTQLIGGQIIGGDESHLLFPPADFRQLFRPPVVPQT